MNTSRFLLLTLVTIFMCSFSPHATTSKKINYATQERSSGDSDSIREIIEKYVSLCRAGKLEELKNLTTAVPKSALKYPPNDKMDQSAATTVAVLPRPPTGEYEFKWIRKDLPESFFKTQHRIVKTGELVIEKPFAKIPIFFGDDEVIFYVPWVFMLTQDADGTWKIYDIKSPAYAEDYRP